MKFKSLEEFNNYLNENYNGDITLVDISMNTIINESIEPIIKRSMVDVNITSLGGDPLVKAIKDVSLTENVLYVKSFESIPMSCGTGRITLGDREFYSNICEMDDSASISLDIMDGDANKRLCFKLVLESERTDDPSVVMVLGNAE